MASSSILEKRIAASPSWWPTPSSGFAASSHPSPSPPPGTLKRTPVSFNISLRRCAAKGSTGSINTDSDAQICSDTWIELARSEEHTSELQSRGHLVCRLLLEKKKATHNRNTISL